MLAAADIEGIALFAIRGVEPALARGAGVGPARTAGLAVGLSRPALVDVVGRDVVLPDMALERAAALAVRLGRAGTGGGTFRLTGTGGASLPALPGVVGADGSTRDEPA